MLPSIIQKIDTKYVFYLSEEQVLEALHTFIRKDAGYLARVDETIKPKLGGGHTLGSGMTVYYQKTESF